MGWTLEDPNDRAIIAEIEKQSDRGVLIIAASFLEARLEQAIRLCLVSEIGAELNGKVFKGTGPLATFSARIDLGYLLQLYPDEMRNFLHKIRNLRNDAAHETSAISFDLPTIKSRCDNIIIDLKTVVLAGMMHHMQLMRATRLIPEPKPLKVVYEGGFESEYYSLRGDPEAAKDKFLAAIKAVLFHLHQVGQIFEKIRLVLPPRHA